MVDAAGLLRRPVENDNAAMPDFYWVLIFILAAIIASVIIIVGLRRQLRPETFHGLLIGCGFIALLLGIYVAVGAPFLSANAPDVTRFISIVGWSLIGLATVLIVRGALGKRP
jgi:hypothetical protein